ncbi:glycosyltransferase, partial [Thioalkalivibrio sp.]|uniref:glycosyltransferase n=1 Tax=Thioalkalivibrio sp. TaxID=2093813 RepID=UPI003563CB05
MIGLPSRIAFLVHSLGLGGAERNTVNLANRFAAEGWEVLVITSANDSNDVFKLAPPVARHILKCHRPSGLRAGPWSLVCRIAEIRAVLKRFQPQALVCMMTTANVLGTVAARRLPVRVIISERNWPGRQELRLPWRVLRNRVYRHADHFAAQTNEGADWVREHLGLRAVTVIPNAVSVPIAVDTAQPCPEPAADGRKLILAVGTKPHQKGFDLLLQAVIPLLQREPGWSLVVLGINNERLLGQLPKAHKAGEQIDLPLDRIRALGEVGNPGAWYDAAEIFVLSSRFEGFPNVLVEAMAHGCAPVAFACPTGPAEIISDKDTGLLVPNGDIAGLRTAI